MSSGKLYIVPIHISESPLERVLPDFNNKIVKELRHFVVENIKIPFELAAPIPGTFGSGTPSKNSIGLIPFTSIQPRVPNTVKRP